MKWWVWPLVYVMFCLVWALVASAWISYADRKRPEAGFGSIGIILFPTIPVFLAICLVDNLWCKLWGHKE